MNYVEKDFDEIISSLLEDSVDKGLISHADDFLAHIDNLEDISNFYVMTESVFARMFEIVYQSMTSVYESDKIDYAEGEDLDEIGVKKGVPRPSATKSMVEATFTLSETEENDITLPSGVELSTPDGVAYVTLEEIYIPAGENESTVQCESVDTGPETRIVADTLTRIDSNLEYNFTVTNKENSSGGNTTYSDDEYRYLLVNWFKIHLKGSLEAFENYFANFDGIDGYKLMPNWGVTGYSKIIVDPGTSYQLNQIYNELQSDVAQYNEDLFLCAPEDVYIDVYASVNVDIDQINPYSVQEKEDIRNRFINAIKIFIDGGYTSDGEYYEGLLIGEDFIPHKLAVFLDDEIPELKNITFSYPEDYISITDEGKGKSNNITIEMI